MLRSLSLFFVGLLSLLSSCAYQPMTCPAYQSAYIHDKAALRKKFSYFQDDSIPRVYATNKSKFLIIEPSTFKKKERSLQTIEKKAVPVVVPDSLKEGYVKPEEAFAMAERNVDDTTAVIRIDTVATVEEEYQISKEKEIRVLKYDNQKRQYWVDTLGYNNDQDNYMWYLRHVLVLPDAKLAALGANGENGADDKSTGKTKRKGGFFKNLFKKKEKADTVEGFEGTTSATILPSDKKTKKVKKKKEKKKPVEEAVDPAKKEEEEEADDDGF